MAGKLEASIIIKLFDQVSNPLRAATQNFKAFREAAQQSKKAFQLSMELKQTAEGMAHVAEKAKALFDKPVEAATTFEQSLARIRIQTGASAADMDAMGKEAIAMATGTEFSAEQVAAAMAGIARAGKNPAQVAQQVGEAMDFASAHQINLASSTSLVGGVIKSFGMDLKETAAVQDTLTQASRLTGASVETMGGMLKDMGAPLQAMGVKMPQVVTLMGLMGKAGVPIESAGGAIYSMAQALSGGGRRGLIASKALQHFGIQAKDSSGNLRDMGVLLSELAAKTAGMTNQKAILAKMFGAEGADQVMVLFKQGPAAMAKFSAEMAKAGGSTKAASDIMNQTNDESKDKLKAAWTTMYVAVGTTLLPAMKKLTGVVVQIISTVTAWSQAHPGLTKAIMWTVFAVGALFGALASALSVIGSLVGAFGFAALALGIKKTGAQLLWAAVKAIPAFVTQLWTMITTMVSGAFPALAGMASAAWAAIAPFLPFAAAIGAVVAAVAELIKYWKELNVLEGFKGIKEMFGEKGLLATAGAMFDPTALVKDIGGMVGLGGGKETLASPGITKSKVEINGGIQIGLAKGLQNNGMTSSPGFNMETYTNTGPAMGY